MMNISPSAPPGLSGAGRVIRIAGPVVGATGLDNVRVYDVVRVGDLALVGEVIRLDGDLATIQVYEDTTGLRVGEPVISSGMPLAVELGPGLLGSVYDGLQRPLSRFSQGEAGFEARPDPFLARGAQAEPLDTARHWQFTPQAAIGDPVGPFDILGFVPETAYLKHSVMAPPGAVGRIATMAPAGPVTIHDVVATIESADHTFIPVTLAQRWPVRRPRPAGRKLNPNQPLITGTRILDAFFPIAKGGAGIIPGGFGTGKTVAEQSLARWADADIVVYIGCGERGNEMAEVLTEFPQLTDPRHGQPLMARTILIANTSNMPVAAREASIYTGITIAEYYRDMGYAVLLLADSTSRWGEALREISSRLEEMPGEEGYPAYLAARLAEFYERSGRVAMTTSDSAERSGSVTIIGAVSPPGGDFSEPVTQSSLRVAGAYWALDYDLSRRRHFPAINWLNSYTLYPLDPWYTEHIAPDWPALRQAAMTILQQEAKLQEIVQLVGPDTLGDEQKLLLAVARMLREDFLQQNALHPVDGFCPPAKAEAMLRVILGFQAAATTALGRGVPLETIQNSPVVLRIGRMKELPLADAVPTLQALAADITTALGVSP